jgi:peroxiredoxin
MHHLPQYIAASDEMRQKGVDIVACVSVNDAFVMDAWGKSLGADGRVAMLADGDAKFARAMGTDLDLTGRNAGIRSQRYSAIIVDLRVLLSCSC